MKNGLLSFWDFFDTKELFLLCLIDYTDNSICVAGKRITPKLLAEALRTLPEEKRNAVLLYYFEGMTDNDIAKLLNISRSTVQYRRTSSFELLKRYLEERAYDDEEI